MIFKQKMLLEGKCVYKYASALLNVYITAFIGDTIKASKTACRWFLLEMSGKAVDIIKCTSLDSRGNPVIKR